MVSLRRRRGWPSSREISELELQFPNLGQVLACYLYQYWDEEYSSSEDALRAAKENQQEDQLERAVLEIDELVSRDLDDDSLNRIVVALAGGGGPDTHETSMWLAQARRILSGEDVQ
jgi:CdiI immunity protein